ncbi:MAG: hypothetical protein WC590_13415 [Burkholderiaceae bacterium]
MKVKILIVTTLALMLSACATTQLPATSQHYDPSDSARIRLFGQNGKPAIMTVEVSPGKTVEVNVGGGAGDAFGSLLGTVKSESIGISDTQNTENLQQGRGILSKVFYREFVIPAGRQVQVKNAFIGLTNVTPNPGAGITTIHKQGSCQSQVVSFVPQAGKDYEVGSYKTGAQCSVMVFEIQQQQGKTVLKPVEIQ